MVRYNVRVTILEVIFVQTAEEEQNYCYGYTQIVQISEFVQNMNLNSPGIKIFHFIFFLMSLQWEKALNLVGLNAYEMTTA